MDRNEEDGNPAEVLRVPDQALQQGETDPRTERLLDDCARCGVADAPQQRQRDGDGDQHDTAVQPGDVADVQPETANGLAVDTATMRTGPRHDRSGDDRQRTAGRHEPRQLPRPHVDDRRAGCVVRLSGTVIQHHRRCHDHHRQ